MAKQIYEYFTLDEQSAVEELTAALQWDEKLSLEAHNYAVDLIKRIRKTKRIAGSLESFFQEYGLNTQEGLSLMSMAEALLRIPDSKTANMLIRDKVAGTNWLQTASKGDKDWMTKAAGLGLKLSGSTMNSLFSKLGEPIIREAMMKAMRLLGKQFVLGKTLMGAANNAKKWEDKNYRFSYDMLGEGARTSAQANKYFESYRGAILDIASLDGKNKKLRSGISVKLSALHPRYEFSHREKCIPAITEKLLVLCELAAKNKIDLTVDAEEVARLYPSLEIIENICKSGICKKWHGFGLAVQAYQKAAPTVIDHIISLTKAYNCKMQIRLVKGAYWDTEIKHAQVEGLDDYPVYTRKSNTDLSYLRCAQKLLRHRDMVYPMFGTHNAHTVAAIIKMAGDDINGFQFQKLYGMGDALYNQIIADQDVTVSVYAPVGAYEELLPYLVRRMLENGANSSFVNQIYDKEINPENVAIDPVEKAKNNEFKQHPKIPLPSNLFGNVRKNSAGIDFNNPPIIEELIKNVFLIFANKKYFSAPLIAGDKYKKSSAHDVVNPAMNDDVVGSVHFSTPDLIEKTINTATLGHQIWSNTPSQNRAEVLEKIADLLEANKQELMSLCIREGGRTLKDAHDEVREAVDFCRYYAMYGRRDFIESGRNLTSPTGESNVYKLESRGIFICISPWNFPIAIYTGQIVAALMAGNSVIAKPAEQTSLTGYYIAQLILKAGVPSEAFTFLPGDGNFGAALVEHADIAGIAFTGSTAAAQSINKSLAAKTGGITKFIAETGGQNVMIVDSSALTEQVIDDVIHSAFGSAGQRCSACRVLYVQEDVYDKTVLMLQGAMQELKIGDPMDLSSDLGPLIDEQAYMNLQQHKTRLAGFGKKLAETPMDNSLQSIGHYFPPMAYQIDKATDLEGEVFGPALHVISYKLGDIDEVIADINALGYGLTFGVHSRIQSFIQKLTAQIQCGNIYINRGTIGAVVGVQPFGGRGLSGTGPKAGGPQYLHGFASEKVISTNTTAAGGNASLIMLQEE